MERYKDIDGDSNIEKYEIGTGFVRVQFFDGSIYLYTYESAGPQNIERMKVLANNGDGLNAFINANCRKRYSRREK